MKKLTIMLNGKYIGADAPALQVLSPGRLPDRGIFETMRAYHRKVFLLNEHLTRMNKGLKLLKIRRPLSLQKIEQCLDDVLRKNSLFDARIRLAIWQEDQEPNYAIVAQPVSVPKDKYEHGFKAMVSKVKRNPSRTTLIKTLDYSELNQAFNEAVKKGVDEAILLNDQNELVEGSRTNVFYAQNGRLFTPAVLCGCLNGITRQWVIRSARKCKIPFKSVRAKMNHLLQADEAFLTNSVIGIMPLTMVGRRIIGRGQPGPLTLKFLQLYHREVNSR